MGFTDGKPFKVTNTHISTRWGLDGNSFRCYMCGKWFEEGDTARWQHTIGRTIVVAGQPCWLINFLVCVECDGPDVLDRWVAQNEEARRRFWWL